MGAVVMLAAMGAAVGAVKAEPDLIAVRQAAFDMNSGTAALIKQVLADKGDLKSLVNPAKGLAKWGAVIPSMFPKGTETGGNTKALPEIWSDPAGFQKAAEGYSAAATKLAEAAQAGDADAVAADFKVLGDACGTCHKAYRAK